MSTHLQPLLISVNGRAIIVIRVFIKNIFLFLKKKVDRGVYIWTRQKKEKNRFARQSTYERLKNREPRYCGAFAHRRQDGVLPFWHMQVGEL